MINICPLIKEMGTKNMQFYKIFQEIFQENSYQIKLTKQWDYFNLALHVLVHSMQKVGYHVLKFNIFYYQFLLFI